MPRLQIAPTRSNLFRIRDALALAREGYEILDKKREVLTTELIHVAHDAATLQERVWALLAEAYQALITARLTMGREHLEWAALSVAETTEVTTAHPQKCLTALATPRFPWTKRQLAFAASWQRLPTYPRQ